jgi:hypothetical protein
VHCIIFYPGAMSRRAFSTFIHYSEFDTNVIKEKK